MHGSVLTKLVRSDKPITLRMIETNPKETWSAYTLNDEVILYVKYSTKPQQRKKNEDILIWSFTFSIEQLVELCNLRQCKNVYVALVCGQRNVNDPNMYICLIDPNEVDECIYIRAN